MAARQGSKILVIEDEPMVRVGLEDNLAVEGYEVIACEDGEKGLQAFRDLKPDLVILDIMMPGMDGLEVCRRIRAHDDGTPIILLTARSTEIDKVVGLEVGADDYLTKPFGMRELAARVKAHLRRSSTITNVITQEVQKALNEPNDEVSFSDVHIDFRTYRAERAGEEVVLSAKEFEVLRYLSAKPDQPVSRNELLDQVWGYNSYPSTRTVDNFIARLRQKLEEQPDKPRHIQTVHGVGYKFVP